MPSTKSDLLVAGPSNMILKNLYVAPNAFRGLVVKEGGRVLITARKFDKIEFAPQSIVNMKQLTSSVFSFSVIDSGLVLFRARCADSWRPFVDDYLDPSGNGDYDTGTNLIICFYQYLENNVL